MSVERIGKGYVKICVSEEELGKCCVDCNFIDQKGADELMCLAAYLAGNEQARAEAQQKAGKKA